MTQSGQTAQRPKDTVPTAPSKSVPSAPCVTETPPPLSILPKVTPEPSQTPKPKPSDATAPKAVGSIETILEQLLTQAETPSPATVAKTKVPCEPTAFERRLQMLRNWFLYGRADGVTKGDAVEKLLATTWLLRCSILVILFTSVFLLKLSIDRGILAPSGRVALSYLAGTAVLIAGLNRRMRQRYWSMGQALCGIGLGMFYFSSFAMTSMYHLASATIGGAVMCLTTVTAGVLADRLNSISIAMVAMFGGYVTPASGRLSTRLSL